MEHVLIIAEAGVNHNGNFNKALELIEVAASAGADYVKFQTFNSKQIVSKTAKKAVYQIENTSNGDTQLKMLQKLEIPLEWYPKLIAHCKTHQIQFLSTGFDCESIELLERYNIPLYKIPSGEITHKALLQQIAKKNKPVILSTGMAIKDEIKNALDVLLNEGLSIEQITVLHCNTQYPTPLKDVNLRAMLDIKNTFGVKVGYSDHTLGIEVPIAAVALGASVIEKHFTLDKTLEGPDHKASLNPTELKQMIFSIRNTSLAISGTGIKELMPSEVENKSIARKSLFYKKSLSKGTILEGKHFVALRPESGGISPMNIDSYIGRELIKQTEAFEQVKLEHIR